MSGAKITVVRKLPESPLFPERELWKVQENYYVAYLYSDGVVQVYNGDGNGNSFGLPLFGHNTDDRETAERNVLDSRGL